MNALIQFQILFLLFVKLNEIFTADTLWCCITFPLCILSRMNCFYGFDIWNITGPHPLFLWFLLALFIRWTFLFQSLFLWNQIQLRILINIFAYNCFNIPINIFSKLFLLFSILCARIENLIWLLIWYAWRWWHWDVDRLVYYLLLAMIKRCLDLLVICYFLCFLMELFI